MRFPQRFDLGRLFRRQVEKRRTTESRSPTRPRAKSRSPGQGCGSDQRQRQSQAQADNDGLFHGITSFHFGFIILRVIFLIAEEKTADKLSPAGKRRQELSLFIINKFSNFHILLLQHGCQVGK